MSFLLTVVALFLCGWGAAGRLWRDGEAGPLERAAAGITVAVSLWLAPLWIFALTQTLTRPLLLARTGVLLIFGIALLARWRWPNSGAAGFSPPDGNGGLKPATPLWNAHVPTTALFFVVPVGLWTAFVIWRGAILPPLTHDVLSNHLPRAVLWVRSHGFVDLTRVSLLFRDMPANYEMLLADMVAMLRHDRYTEWLGTIFFLAFLAVAGALAERWWRNATITIATMILTAATPVLLLHSGGDKNDVLTATFMVAALVWGGRFWRTGDFASLLLLGCSVLIAFGTKPQGGIIGAALLPFVLWRARRLRPRALAGALAFGVAAFIVLGGWTYIDHRLPMKRAAAPAPEGSKNVKLVTYGDWANLWQGPYVLLAAPFAPSEYHLPVPWESQPWFWKRYEIFFSHLGAQFALCFLAAPFARAAWRDSERVIGLIAALLTLIAMLPVVFYPHGFYLISLPRYALFIVPPAIAWTAGAAMFALSARTKTFVIAAAAVLFVIYATDFAVKDSFAPLDSVLKARKTPGTRYIPFDPYRATSVVDTLAGPRDVIALDVAWASWIHPAFGEQLSRPVYFIRPGKGPVRVPDAVDWVVVERAYEVIWGHKQMKTLAQARELFHRNVPRPAAMRVNDALRRDPRFRLVWEEPGRNQAVFRRIR